MQVWLERLPTWYLADFEQQSFLILPSDISGSNSAAEQRWQEVALLKQTD